jgi:hypothetical protein
MPPGCTGPAGGRGDDRSVADEHDAATEFVGHHDCPVCRLGRVVRLVADTGCRRDNRAGAEIQLQQLVGSLQRHPDGPIWPSEAQMPGGSPRRNRLACRAGCGVEQLDTVRFAHSDRTDSRRSDDDSFGRVADGHPDARGR